jgi:predicted aconitase
VPAAPARFGAGDPHHLLARHHGPLVAQHVGEDLTALALPVGTQAAQILVHVVGVTEADRASVEEQKQTLIQQKEALDKQKQSIAKHNKVPVTNGTAIAWSKGCDARDHESGRRFHQSGHL